MKTFNHISEIESPADYGWDEQYASAMNIIPDWVPAERTDMPIVGRITKKGNFIFLRGGLRDTMEITREFLGAPCKI